MTSALPQTIVVVPTERHVERLGLAGARAETRARLVRRLLEALAPEAKWAPPDVARLALTESLRATLWDDPLLGALVRAGGGPFLRTVELVDAAIGELRRAGTPIAALDHVEELGGGAGVRASALRRAIVGLDRTLEARGLIDARNQPRLLADVLRRATPDAVLRAVGARSLAARFIVAWDPADLKWWRTLGTQLAEAGGHVSLELPVHGDGKLSLDTSRDRGALDALFDEVAPWLDAPPETLAIEPVLGDFQAGIAPSDPARVTVTAAADATRQARAVVHAVATELARGTPVDRLAICVPRLDEDVLVPLRTAFDEAGIPVHEPRGAPPGSAAIVAAAMTAHGLAALGLPRLDVAMLLRSRYVDAVKLTGLDDRLEAKRAVADMADALERAPSKAATDAARALEETIVAGAGDEGERLRPYARRVAEVLSAVEGAKTRSAHARAARTLWDALGFPSRVSLDARATLASDAVPIGIARAELAALSRDAHAWRVLVDAVDAYAAAIVALGLSSSPATSEVFRYELERTLEAGAAPPGAGRIGAVRITRLTELGGEALERLFLLDANEGVLPGTESPGPLLTEGLAARIRELDAEVAPVTPSAMRARELALLALAASEAKTISVFYREMGGGDEALAPSAIVQALVRAGAATRRAGGGALLDAPLSAREAHLQSLLHAGASAGMLDPDAFARTLAERTRESFHGVTVPRARNVVAGDIDVDETLALLLAEESGAGERALPVTSLERFARCAFQGYVHQILGARDVRVANETPDAREAGTMVHEALAAAMRAAAPVLRVRPVDADAARALAMEAADRVLWRGAESPLRKLAIELARERVSRVVEWSLAQDDWVFAYAEQTFGDERDETTWRELTMGEGPHAVRLRGSIDRVDLSRGDAGRRVRIIDYKSSADTVQKARRELGHTMLQVPIYALAARDALSARDAEGLYLPVAELEPTASDDAGFVKRWQELSRDDAAPLRDRVREVIERVRTGALAPTPEKETFCDQCSFDGVCRRPRFVASEDEGDDGGGRT